uniref:Innexin1 n=1 Tax=Dicyema koshidai TaxID=632974 RepID=D3KVC3_9BILA|nr:innexin1 [Dicyema koshidai]
MQFVRYIGTAVATSNVRKDDDTADRLSYRYASTFLVVCGIIVITRNYVGEPIHCWCPANFPGQYISYANSICWVKGTYYQSLDKKLPSSEELQRDSLLAYYQWVQFIFVFMALLFYVPVIVWRAYVANSGLNLNKIISTCIKAQNVEKVVEKDKPSASVAAEIDNYVLRRDCVVPRGKALGMLAKMVTLTGGRRQGNYLTIAYCITKLLFLLNIVGQFFVLNGFLGFQFNMYGFNILNEYVHGRETNESSFFPRVTYCDFSVREVNRLHTYTVQCVLQVNLFLEKIFVVLWIFYLIIAVYSAFSTLNWLYCFLSPRVRTNYISSYIHTMPSNNLRLRLFVTRYLKDDGFFIFKLISHNVNNMVLDDVINAVWRGFEERDRVPSIEEVDPKYSPL